MSNRKVRPYSRAVKSLMAEKTKLLSQAYALSEMGLEETARPLWAAAAVREEQIAPVLESLGRETEAAAHRISAASCYEKTGDLSRAANLYSAALAGPLGADSRSDVAKKLESCLTRLRRDSTPSRKDRTSVVAIEI